MAEKPVLIMVTTGGRNDAERIGEALVVEHLAACCSVVPMIHSFYYWEGQLKREHEALLMIKTVESSGPTCSIRSNTLRILGFFETMLWKL